MKKVKKLLSLLVVGTIALSLAGCGAEEKSSAGTKNITIGVCPGPYGDMINDAIAPYLERC